MTTYFAKTYDGVSLDARVSTIEETNTIREQSAAPAGRGGRFDAGPLFDRKLISLEGKIKSSDFGDASLARQAWNDWCALFAPGPAKKLYIDSDRYALVTVASELHAQPWKGLPWRAYGVTLAASDDPPWFAETATTAALTAGANTVTTAGTGKADPAITLVVTHEGTITITDAAGKVCRITPAVTGTYVIDSLLEQVTMGGVDVTAILGSSQFLRLGAGANTLTLALSDSATISSASISWRDRWY